MNNNQCRFVVFYNLKNKVSIGICFLCVIDPHLNLCFINKTPADLSMSRVKTTNRFSINASKNLHHL